MTQLPPAAPEYDTITFDPGTQLTHFHDTHGAIVDMTKGTVTMSSESLAQRSSRRECR
ncbi:hypothetical protein [Nonomuraea sp. NPDC048916]|uniref:hypothetical protein n=1 Tax=Nonomuraea sp. NPDC048916 TaxID=3154232 RepID=UPI0033CA299E